MAAAARVGRDDVLNDATLHHVRTAAGRQEIDLLLEFDGGRVIAVEVKAGAAPTRADARHLLWLRDELGASFVAGAVLHTGPEVIRLDDRIAAIPIASLWSNG